MLLDAARPLESACSLHGVQVDAELLRKAAHLAFEGTCAAKKHCHALPLSSPPSGSPERPEQPTSKDKSQFRPGDLACALPAEAAFGAAAGTAAGAATGAAAGAAAGAAGVGAAGAGVDGATEALARAQIRMG